MGIELVMESPVAVHRKHCNSISTLLLATARSAPSTLLSSALIRRLVKQLSLVLQKATEDVQPAAVRKRKHGEDLAAVGPSQETSTELVQAVCSMLVQLLDLGAPLVQPQQVASLAEQLIGILWLGVMAPTAKGTRNDAFSVGSAPEAGTSAGRCRDLCQDSRTAVAMLDLVAALHQPSRVGVSMMAPNAVDSFAALLAAMSNAHQRRIPRRMATLSCRAEHANESVRLRATEVRSYLLRNSGSSAPTGSSASNAVISISWPEPKAASEPVASVPGRDKATCTDALEVDKTNGREDFFAPRAAPEQTKLDSAQQEAHVVAAVEASPPGSAAPAPIDSPQASDVRGHTSENVLPATATLPAPVTSDVPAAAASLPVVHAEAAPSAPIEAASPTTVASPTMAASPTVAGKPASLFSTTVETPIQTRTAEPEKGEPQNDAHVSGVKLDAAALLASSGQQEALLQGIEDSLELFPEDGDADDISIPELCMDSPDSDNADEPLLPG